MPFNELFAPHADLSGIYYRGPAAVGAWFDDGFSTFTNSTYTTSLSANYLLQNAFIYSPDRIALRSLSGAVRTEITSINPDYPMAGSINNNAAPFGVGNNKLYLKHTNTFFSGGAFGSYHNIDHLYYYNGTSWVEITGSGFDSYYSSRFLWSENYFSGKPVIEHLYQVTSGTSELRKFYTLNSDNTMTELTWYIPPSTGYPVGAEDGNFWSRPTPHVYPGFYVEDYVKLERSYYSGGSVVSDGVSYNVPSIDSATTDVVESLVVDVNSKEAYLLLQETNSAATSDANRYRLSIHKYTPGTAAPTIVKTHAYGTSINNNTLTTSAWGGRLVYRVAKLNGTYEVWSITSGGAVLLATIPGGRADKLIADITGAGFTYAYKDTVSGQQVLVPVSSL